MVDRRTVRIQFKPNLPFHMENLLHNKFNFRISSRQPGSFIVFAKDIELKPKKVTKPAVFVVDGLLTEERESELIKQCNKILDWYDNPHHHAASIRMRLKNIAMAKPTLERMFIEGWTDRNVPFGSNKALE